MEADPDFVELGAAANLLRGLRPQWSGPLFVPPRKPFVTFAVDRAVPDAAAWSEPTLSLHDDVDSLIDAIFDFRVLPFQGDPPPFRVPASALMPAERTELSDRFGLDLSSDAGGYLLLKMRRETGDFMHEGARGGIGQRIQIKNYWTPEGRYAMGRLRTGERIVDGPKRRAVVNTQQAQRYLDYCYDFGTHFVTRVIVGDVLLQVFACKPARYAQIKSMFAREARGTSVSGPLARGFRFLATSDWISARGTIVSAAGDEVLTDDLLAPFSRPPTKSRATAPITIGLSCQSQFMEVFRSGVFARVVKGALLQKCGRRIRLPVVRKQSVVVPAEFSFPATAVRSDDGYSAFCIAFELPEPRSLDAKSVSLCAYRAVFGSGECGVSTLTLSDAALDDFQFVAEEMEGALLVTNGDGTRRETLHGGLHFFTDEDGVVALRAPAELSRLVREGARRTLDYAESLISGGVAEEVLFAKRYLDWLETITGESFALVEGAAPMSVDVSEIVNDVARIMVPTNDLTRRILSGDETVTPLLEPATAALRELADRITPGDPPAGSTPAERFFAAKWRLIKAAARLASAQPSPKPPR